MVNNFASYISQNHTPCQMIMGQIRLLKQRYTEVEYKMLSSCRTISIFIKLKPTENSIIYTLRIDCHCVKKTVKIFIINPPIGKEIKGKRIPHLYENGSLCLYYPKNNEWNYTDVWAETLIPWACLWLYYFELWQFTGEWIGGGIHINKQ